MRFLGKVWRLLVGIKDGLVLLFMLIFFGLLYAALSAEPYAGGVRTGALTLDLSGTLAEQPAAAEPIAALTGSALAREHRLRDLLAALRAAATDGRVKAVALDLDAFAGGGQAAVGEAGDALGAVRRADKPVVAYATAYTDDGYQLAAHASEIWVNPMGGVAIAGPGGSRLYYKGLLDRLGVTANVYRVGTYKSAVEPYTRGDMSPEARRAAEALAGDLWESWRQDVARARPKARLAEYLAGYGAPRAGVGGDLAREALAAGLVDRIGDRADFERRMAALVGADAAAEADGYRATSLEAFAAANPSSDASGEIGVLTVAGTIVDGEAGPGTAGAETIVAALKDGLRAGGLKALVIRIDSPGGSALASERVRRAIADAKASGLPVVVSMGSVAASGGYWIATAGDTIFAEPSTITGSIGVFGILPSFEGALAKLGIGADGVRTTPLSGQPDLLGGISPEADRLLQLGVDGTYRRFLALVAASRRMPAARVDAIAQGRVWPGGAARQLGLVDRFGTLDDAVAEAARRAGLDPAAVKPRFLEAEPGFWQRVFAGWREAGSDPPDAFTRVALRPERLLAEALADAEQMLSGAAIQARCLECPRTGRPPATAAGRSWLRRLAAIAG